MHSFYDVSFNRATTALPEEESKHASRSLRLKIGDHIQLLNGSGDTFLAQIEFIDKRQTLLKVFEVKTSIRLHPELHIYISPLKFQDRFEWFLEKAGELGVTSITPIICHRTERFHPKPDRWERILIASLKQSGQAYLSKLNDPASFDEALENCLSPMKLIPHCEAGSKNYLSSLERASDISIFIGPEGDFTPEEIEKAKAFQCIPIDLGETILRTETAGLAICAYLRLQELK